MWAPCGLVFGGDDCTVGSSRRHNVSPLYFRPAVLSSEALYGSHAATLLCGFIERMHQGLEPTPATKEEAKRAFHASWSALVHDELRDLWVTPLVLRGLPGMVNKTVIIIPYILEVLGDMMGNNELRGNKNNACPWCFTTVSDLTHIGAHADDMPPPRSSSELSAAYEALRVAPPAAKAELLVALAEYGFGPIEPSSLMKKFPWAPFNLDGVLPAHVPQASAGGGGGGPGGFLEITGACWLHDWLLGFLDYIIHNLPLFMMMRRAEPRGAAAAAAAAPFVPGGPAAAAVAEARIKAVAAALKAHSRAGEGQRARKAAKNKSKIGAAERRTLNRAIAAISSYRDGDTTRERVPCFFGGVNMTGNDNRAVLPLLVAVLDSVLIPDPIALAQLRELYGTTHVILDAFGATFVTELQRISIRDKIHRVRVLAFDLFAGYPGFTSAPKMHFIIHDFSLMQVYKGAPRWATAAFLELAHAMDVKDAFGLTNKQRNFLEQLVGVIARANFLKRIVPRLLAGAVPNVVFPKANTRRSLSGDFQRGAFVPVAHATAIRDQANSIIAANMNGIGSSVIAIPSPGAPHMRRIVAKPGSDLAVVGAALCDTVLRPDFWQVSITPLDDDSYFSGKLSGCSGTLASLAWACTSRGLDVLSAAFATAVQGIAFSTVAAAAANGGQRVGALRDVAALALCRTYNSFTLRRGIYDQVLKPGDSVVVMVGPPGCAPSALAVSAPTDPALVSCAQILAFFVAVTDKPGPLGVIVPSAARVQSEDTSSVYALVLGYDNTLPTSATRRRVVGPIDVMAPRVLEHDGHVEGLYLVSVATIVRGLRPLPVGTVAVAQSAPCTTGLQPVGPFAINVSLVI